MFQAACMLYVYAETPLHAGSGRGLGGVDLPIQRERVTGYPIVQASSLKGKLRAEAYLCAPYVQKREGYCSQIETELRQNRG
jgi:CRISPR type III-B/RAMP module RAMP protein Cmr4